MQKDYSILMLEGILLFFLITETQACRITVDSFVIHLGSPLLASCSSYCPQIGRGAVVWKLDNDLLSEAHYRNVHKNESSVYISGFNKTSGLLQCYVNNSEGLQLMDEIHIRAGYPPSLPTNLKCLMNPSDDIVTCTWLPVEDSLLATNVTLSWSRSVEQCVIPAKSEFTCTPVAKQNFCSIQRGKYHHTKILAVWITVKNELGSATSAPVCFIPRDEVKLDPVVFTEAQATTEGCIKLQWSYGKADFLKDLKCQLRYRNEFQEEWDKLVEVSSDTKTTNQCGLLSATNYTFQIRCIRERLTGQWSEWGPSRSGITSESAPTGILETWWKILEATEDSLMKVQLFWKPLRKEEANAKHIWYVIGLPTDMVEKETTTALNCILFLPPGIRKAFIWAQNTAGASPKKEIIFFATNGDPVPRMDVLPNNDYSLRVEWEAQVSATAYVLEWCKSAQPRCDMYWKTEPKGSSTSILHDNIEPYQMYNVTLYPVYEASIGTSVQTNAYSKEKAPSFSPELKLADVDGSQAEVQWEPIPLDKRNGFITSYTVFWKDTHGKENFSAVNGSVTRFKIKNLLPFTAYKVFLRSSTAGGRVNGSMLTVYTTPDQADNTLMLLVLVPLLFLVTILVFIICIMKHERMKNQLWPIVPDPAKSQMGKLAFFVEEVPRIMVNPTDVTHFSTSDISIVEGWQGKTLLIESHIKEAPTTNIAERNSWRSYVNTDTVQYAQVITGGYREQSPPTSVYVRSDSTQPLLCDMSPSPQNYENMWFHSHHQEDSVFLVEDENVTDFPLLQALQIHENEESFNLLN